MRAAYVHVLADAGTSLLAIVALACGYYFGLGILDPLAALVGAFVIASWAYGLIRDSAMVLLDADADPKLSGAIKSTIEEDLGARVADLHLWRLGPGHHGLIVSLVSPDPTTAEQIKTALRQHYPDLSHVTVEVAICADLRLDTKTPPRSVAAACRPVGANTALTERLLEDRDLARDQPFALHALALQLAVAAHRLGPFAGALLGGLLIGAAQLHLPENAFALHLLFQRLERLVDIVVADDDLQRKAPVCEGAVDNRRLLACLPAGINAFGL